MQVSLLGPVPDIGNKRLLQCHYSIIDFEQRVTVHLAGLALNCNRNARTFTLDLNISVASYKKAKDANNQPVRPVVPIHCIIPHALKGTPVLPMPDNRCFVSVRGRLCNVIFRNNNRHLGVESFHVVAEEIVFLGQLAAKVSTQPRAAKRPRIDQAGMSKPEDGESLHMFSTFVLTFLIISALFKTLKDTKFSATCAHHMPLPGTTSPALPLTPVSPIKLSLSRRSKK